MQPFEVFETTLRDRFHGRLEAGAHAPDGVACALEAAHVAIGEAWSDKPDLWPDMRPLNDAEWSSPELRAAQMSRVLRAWWDWSTWSADRRQRAVERLAILTVQRIVAELPGLTDDDRTACRAAQTLDAADAAADAAAMEATRDAAWAARDAARAASAAWAASAAMDVAWAASASARAARDASGARDASDAVLITACDVWVEVTDARC